MKISNCPICLSPFHLPQKQPRILPKCGHTICQQCLVSLKTSPGQFQCPQDDQPYDSEKDLSFFPANEHIISLLMEMKNVCEDHKKVKEYYCLDEVVKICSDCGLFGKHQRHKKENSQGLRKKNEELLTECEEGLEGFQFKQDYRSKRLLTELVRQKIDKMVG